MELSKREMQELARRTANWIIDYYEHVEHRRLFPLIKPEVLRRTLVGGPPMRGKSLSSIFEEFETLIAANSRQNLHARFFGYVSSSANPVAAFADALCSALNQNVTAWRSAPSAVELELLVADWLKGMVGYPKSGFGMLMSGGSMATLTALAIARRVAAGPAVTTSGVQSVGNRRRLRIYASDQVHFSVLKAAEVLGLGREAVRVLESDGNFRLDPAQLSQAIDEDRRRGDIPMCVVAAVGTVSTGAIDPLDRIADVCKARHVWLHVDAAYGGFAAMTSRGRELMNGVGRADSVSLDPHKWLFQPIDAGCLLVGDRQLAHEAFSGSEGDYVSVFDQPPGESFAFFEQGIELTRRLRALKIWMTLKYYGVERVSNAINRTINLARTMESLIKKSDELELLAPVELSIFCFRYVPREVREEYGAASQNRRAVLDEGLNQLNRELMLEIQRGGNAYLSNATLRGKFALRGCIVNYRTRREDLEITRDEVIRIGRKLSRAAERPLVSRFR